MTNSNNEGISLKEFADRRARVYKALNGSPAVVFSGEHPGPKIGKWKADRFFYYLTGIDNEPGAAILFDPTAPFPRNRISLFLKPLNPEMEQWDGYRGRITANLREATGFGAIFRTGVLPGALTQAARRARKLACLHPYSVYPAPVSPDLDVFRKVCERVPGIAIEDQTQLLASMRAIKSSAELGLMKKAIDATAAGFEAAARIIKPGVSESHVADVLEMTYRKNGAQELAYGTIVGSGLNGTVLHYVDNAQQIEKNQLIVIDSGASYCGYAADVTRTFPSDGRFTAEQRDIYDLVLKAEIAAIKAVRPGAKMADVDAAARDVIEKAGFGDFFIHGIGHQLGIDVHDSTPDGPLKPGMIITIEPGVYLPGKKMGVRIEDDILVTPKGHQNLTVMIPKEPREVEAAMRG